MGTKGKSRSQSNLGLVKKLGSSGQKLVMGVFVLLFVGVGYIVVNRSHAATSGPIQHVVVLYLENHSFDNVLGYWCNQNPGRCPEGGMPSSVLLSNGVTVTPTTDPDRVPNIDHSGPGQEAAMDGGKMDGWQNIPPSLGKGTGCSASENYKCISGYQPSQIPNLTTLAQNFAISDNTFSLSDSPSWEGHLYAVAASTDGFWGKNPVPAAGVPAGIGWGCDSNKVTWWNPTPGGAPNQLAPSCVPDFGLNLPNGGAFETTPAEHIPTIMGRLDGKQLPWKIYGAVKGAQGYGIWDICPSFASCLDTKQNQNLVPDEQFATDAAAGNLPAFSVVTPGGNEMVDSCHNMTSMTACDNWVGQIASDVMTSPDWSSTALFITFDDFGGFYDQVYPGTNSNPAMTQQGPRSPMIIVSPFAKPGFTDTTHTTFAGILAFTEHNFGLTPMGPNDLYAYNFLNAFNFGQVPLKSVHMQQRPLPPGSVDLPMFDPNDPT